jgi:uncharacterized protein (TIGR02246 family)
VLAACALLVPLAIACEPATDDPAAEPVPMDEPAPAVAGPPAELEATADRYVAAWNADDPGAVAAFFTEDATVTIGDNTFNGRAEMEERWLPNVPFVSNMQITETNVDQVGDDWRSQGTFSYTASPPDADPRQQTGTLSITWTLDEAGEWRVSSKEIQVDEPAES